MPARPSDPRTGLMRDAAQREGLAGSARAVAGEVSPRRVVIEGVTPAVDGGRFPAKRVVGDVVTVGADVFAEGHDRLAATLRFRRLGEDWQEVAMEPGPNDRWEATFPVTHLGTYEYVVHAWADAFASWRAGLAKKWDARLDVASELLAGAALVRQVAARAAGG